MGFFKRKLTSFSSGLNATLDISCQNVIFVDLLVTLFVLLACCQCCCRGGGVLPNILGGGVPHGSQNPDPISDQNI